MAPSVFLASISVAALSAGMAGAETISTTVNVPETFISNDVDTITSTGAIVLTTGDPNGPAATLDPTFVSGRFDYTGTFTNDGTISVTGSDRTEPTALELTVLGAAGVLRNNNVMSVDVTAGSPADVRGINVTVDAGGLIDNSGQIDLQSTGTSGPASASGIRIGRNLTTSGVISNTGAISVRTSAATSSAESMGIRVDGNANGLITNAGTITVAATGPGGSTASAIGISVRGNAVSGLSNSGTISASASNASTLLAAGLQVRGNLIGGFDNSGTIQANTSDNGPTGIALGLQVGGDVAGDITNSGQITVAGNATTSATAWAVHVEGNLTGNLDNSGTITAIAQGTSGSADAAAVYVEGDTTGNITNSGTIVATGIASASASAGAYYLSGDLNGSFENSGTITGTATSTDDSAEAYALYVSGEMTGDIVNSGTITLNAQGASSADAIAFEIRDGLTGDFVNSGTISVTATDQEDDEVEAYALEVRGGMTGNITNTGTIRVEGNGFSEATVAGFDISGGLEGDFLNSGTITVIATDQTEEVEAYGFDISGGIEGNITNTGTIHAEGHGYSSATVAGFDISGGLEGDFNNSGTITAIATDQTEEAEAYGVDISGGVVGNVTNSGTIHAEGHGYSSATVSGFEISSGLEGNFLNSGTISAVATDQTEEAEAYAIYISGGTTGDITNSGSISANAIGFSEATAAGVYVTSGLEGDFNNSGSITAVATDNTSSAEAYGFYSSGEVTGNITNSGTIDATANNLDTASAYAYGIFLSSTLDGTLSNSGVVTATSVATDDNAESRAIYLRDDTDAVIQNSGEVSATATSESDASAHAVYIRGAYSGDLTNCGTLSAEARINMGTTEAAASAAGVWVEDMQGTFSNTGTITATASGALESEAYGLYFENFDGEITNVGQISATSDTGNAYAIFLGTGTGTLNLVTSDQVEGLIRVEDHNVNLDAAGQSAIFSFEDADPGEGAFVTTTSDPNSGWFVQDEGGSAPVYASVVASDVLISSDVVAYYGNLLSGSTGALGYDAQGQVTRNATTGRVSGLTFGGFRPYAAVDLASRRFENVPGSDTDVNSVNGSVGYSGQLDSGLAVAIGLGVFRADGDTDTTDFDTDGVYLDAAIGRQFGAYTVEAGLGYGWLSTDRSREIVGSNDADADYDSTLLTAYLGVERSFEASNAFDLLAFGDLRYTRQEDDGYTETGSSANATVGDSTTEVIEARLGLEAEKALGNGGILIGQVAGVLRRGLGDSDATVSLFDTTQTLTFASTDFNGASILLGYEHELVTNLQFEANAEQEIGDDAQGPNFQAGLRWSF